MRSGQSVNSLKYLIAAHQTAARVNAPNINTNISIFHNLNVRKYSAEINGYRYPRDSALTNYILNIYLDLYEHIKLFYKEDVGEEIMTLFISHPDMEK